MVLCFLSSSYTSYQWTGACCICVRPSVLPLSSHVSRSQLRLLRGPCVTFRQGDGPEPLLMDLLLCATANK